MTTTVRHALILVEHDGLSGRHHGPSLSDGDSTELCARLKARGIPYVSYSGCDPVKSADTPHIQQAGKHGRIDERNGGLDSGTSPSFLARRDLPACVATDLKLPR
jgi:hypothetical protein